VLNSPAACVKQIRKDLPAIPPALPENLSPGSGIITSKAPAVPPGPGMDGSPVPPKPGFHAEITAKGGR